MRNVSAAEQGYARVLRLVGLDHEDLVSIDDAEGQARLEEGRALLERGKRHAQAAALRSKVRPWPAHRCA